MPVPSPHARLFGCTVASVCVLLPALSVTISPAAAAPDRALDRQVVTLTKSAGGYPTTTAPGRRIKRAVVRAVHRRTAPGVHLSTNVTLRGAPTGNPDSELVLWARRLSGTDGTDCQVDPNQPMASRRVWAADGAVVPTVGEVHAKPSPLWNCVVVMLRSTSNPSVIYDVMVGRLVNKFVTPRLKVGKVGVLGRNQKRLQLVPRATQIHHVTVRNTGGLLAKNVVLVGNGKAIRVRRTLVGRLAPGEATTVRVPITLTGPRAKTKARIIVRGSGRRATRVVPVRRVKAPPAPKVGRWKGGGNTFSFRVKKRAITGFRGINMRMQCTPGGGSPTYRNVSLNFPRTVIPRHGFVDATKRYRKGSAWYNASLRGKVVAGRMVSGRFSYHTAGSCSVIEHFTARRVSR